MSDATPHLGLPLIAAAQAQKHVTHNEALGLLDALVQLACLDKDLSAPPASPAEGDRYLVVAGNPTGAWAGLSGQVVRLQDGVWTGAVPQPGWFAYVIDEADLYIFDGSAWTSFRRAITAIQITSRLGINTAADATNRLAVKSDAALLSWDDATPGSGHMRVAVNKQAAGRDAALVFQTGYSARALLGTLGADDFCLKVSGDGVSFSTALTAAAATGGVDFLSAETIVASAATADIGAAGTRKIAISGTTAITSFGTRAHTERMIRFAGALTLTYDATRMILPTAANITTAAGDTCIATSDAAGNWRVRHYQRADGTALVGSSGAVTSVAGRTGAVTLTSADLTDATGIGRSLATAASAGAARTTLTAAASGANGDITALSGLTTALALGQGGTGATTAGGALANLGGAPLASPALTGTPTVPTAVAGTNTTQAASTAFVSASFLTSASASAIYAPLSSPALTGTPTAPTAAASTNTTQVATTAFVLGQVATASPLAAGTAAVGTSLLFARQDHVHPTDISRAPLASPTFTGTPAAPTAAVDTSTTQLATAAFVLAQAASATPLVDGTAAVGTSTRYARADHIHPTDASRAPLASPALTGSPTAPTASAGTSTTQIATTAFVSGAVAAGGGGTGSAVLYTAQTLTASQQRQALINAGHASGARQTVLSGPAASGVPTFLPASTSGTLSLATQNLATTPLVLGAAGGFDGGGPVDTIAVVGANQSATLAASSSLFLYFDLGTGTAPSATFGSGTLAPIYQFGGTIGTANGQFTFDVQAMQGWLGNGSAAVRASRVYVGEAVTSASAVTSTVAYAYNGAFETGWISPVLPAAAGAFGLAHNLGVVPGVKRVVLENVVSELGYVPGDQVSSDAGLYTFLTASVSAPFGVRATRNGAILFAGAYTAFGAIDQTSGGAGAINRSNWRQKLVVARGW